VKTELENKTIHNALSVDVEDWYHPSLFNNILKPQDFNDYKSRIEENLKKILDLFQEKDVKATFFVLGCIAEKYPSLVKKIDSCGHEIGSHGYNHKLIYTQTQEDFRDEMKRCIEILESIIGKKVLGFRAPTYSITKEIPWVWDVLLELGIKYDSSAFPVKHDKYGLTFAPRFPCKININGEFLYEFPLSTIQIFKTNFPIAGGGYLRLYPYYFIKKSIQHINEKEKKPVVIYFHPWEIDVFQPKVKIDIFKRLRHYGNISANYKKIESLITDFRFTTMKDVLRLN